MGKNYICNAQDVLDRVEKRLAQHGRFLIDNVYEELSIFDWWPTYLTQSHLKQMRTFLKEAIKLGYTGYVSFKVGATGCANGMWAYPVPTEDGYAPRNCPALYRSFTPAYTYWDITDKDGKWEFEGKYSSEEARHTEYDQLKTIKDLEAFMAQHADKVYRK